MVSDGEHRPYRVKIRDPSFVNLQATPSAWSKGYLVADAIAAIASSIPSWAGWTADGRVRGRRARGRRSASSPGTRRAASARPSCRLLYLAQSQEGQLTREGLQEVAGLLGITTAEVEAVATFYTMYRLRPTGEHLVNVCTNLACMLRGGKDVLEAAHQAVGRRPHGRDRSEDGVVSVHEEECLGVCDFAPAVQIDFANHDTVTPERMRELIAALRAGEVPGAVARPRHEELPPRVARAGRPGRGLGRMTLDFERTPHAQLGRPGGRGAGRLSSRRAATRVCATPSTWTART